MNWIEYYKTMPKLAEPELRVSVISWDACKAEVLKILESNRKYGCVDKYGNPCDVINSSVIEEIKKL